MATLAGHVAYPNAPAIERGSPFALLNDVAAASSGTGTEVDLSASHPAGELPSSATLQGIVNAAAGANYGSADSSGYKENSAASGGTGSFSAVSITIEVSLDGKNWTPAVLTLAAAGGEMRLLSGMKFRYVRANVATLTAASGAPKYRLLIIV